MGIKNAEYIPKRCSISLVITEIQIKTTMKYYAIATKCTKKQVWHCRILLMTWIDSYSYTVSENVITLEKNLTSSCQVKYSRSKDQAILLLGRILLLGIP